MGPARGRAAAARARGFTLVEVMVATVLLTMAILGILAVLIGAYRVASKARYSDHARYIIKSFADQFLTGQPYDSSGNAYQIYTVTTDSGGNAAPVGTGLTWTNTDGSNGTVSSDGSTFTVLLGGNTGAPIPATVTRQVWYVTASGSMGQQTLINQNAPAGFLLNGTFKIQYNFLGQPMPPQSISVIRAMP
jgi:type II secretory pathway pseudopilin PulG